MWTDNTYKVVLFGHRDFDGHRMLDEKLYPLLKELIRAKAYVEIYIGRNGEFDIYAATIVKRVQAACGSDNNSFICVLPYKSKDIDHYEDYYDSVIIPECVENTHPKGALTKRNKWMIEESDLLICYVERKCGGAFNALKYAEKLGKKIVNLAN